MLAFLLSACCLQTYQSAEKPEIWYVIQHDAYGGGEADIGAINVTSCLYVTVPIRDYLTQLQLQGNCNGSAGSEPVNTPKSAAGRRLLLEEDAAQLKQALQDNGLLFQPDNSISSVHKFTSRRHLSQAETAATPSAAAPSNACSAAFNNQLPGQTVVSSLVPTISYFAESTLTSDGGADLAFCIVNASRGCCS